MDELVSAGSLGLAEAYSRRGTMTGPEFEKYARCRIYGAILDDLRAIDPLSRRLRHLARAVDAVESRETVRGQERGGDDEVARSIGVSSDAIREVRTRRVAREASSIQNRTFDPLAPSPEEVVTERDALAKMVKAAENLPSPELRVFVECYVNCRSQKEVAVLLGVTGPRVSQIHKQLVRTLASRMGEQEAAEKAA